MSDHLSGRVLIESSLLHPQLGCGFRYREQDVEFWFYVSATIGPPDKSFNMTVTDATSERLGGGVPRFEIADLQRIEDNIRRYLLEFGVFGDGFKQDAPRRVDFSWNVKS